MSDSGQFEDFGASGALSAGLKLSWIVIQAKRWPDALLLHSKTQFLLLSMVPQEYPKDVPDSLCCSLYLTCIKTLLCSYYDQHIAHPFNSLFYSKTLFCTAIKDELFIQIFWFLGFWLKMHSRRIYSNHLPMWSGTQLTTSVLVETLGIHDEHITGKVLSAWSMINTGESVK